LISKRVREPALPLQPVIDPAGWTKERVATSGDWCYRLHDDELADLDRAVEDIEARGSSLHTIGKGDFPLPVLGATLERLQGDLLDGRGFTVIRGVPVERYSRLQSVIAFWAIGSYFGNPVSTNAKGHLVGHVIDVADQIDDPSGRAYSTAKALPFHCDGVVDTVGLMCLQPARSGGESALASTVAIHNAMLARRPDLVAVLARPVYRDRHSEIPAGALPYYPLPVFNYHHGYFSASYHGQNRSLERYAELPPQPSEVGEALELFDSLAQELCFTMTFERGDVQLLNNHVIVHSRITAVQDDPLRKRHLLRLRMMTPNGRPLSPAYFAFQNIPADRIPPRERHSGAILTPSTVVSVPLEPA
jgi:hypothetical protein